MERRSNDRGFEENFVEGRHLKLSDLKQEVVKAGVKIKMEVYLFKTNIPEYPRPEFHVSRLKHDTNINGLRGIRRSGGFRNPGKGVLQWWSLDVGAEEVASAEKRLLEASCPDQTEEQAQRQQSFLGKFATSPAFLKTSRLGSYRFTFPLEEVLEAYSEQFCSGEPPVMRVFETVLYKQGVMYVVLVHSPANQEQFSKYPLLTDDPNAVCTHKDGRLIWRPEAMSETHGYELVLRRDENLLEAQPVTPDPEFYVWDNVTVALHVDEQVLNFDAQRLRENLKFCHKGYPPIDKKCEFLDFPEAEEFVKELWPDFPSPLERAEGLN
ncbi:uncharacterized protein [Pempheris klunzingeri]|uniref:uncharacterized protein n=1 Tax=Pempheris klunzingeri TaxID=3127111 RepID=UPI00397F4556